MHRELSVGNVLRQIYTLLCQYMLVAVCWMVKDQKSEIPAAGESLMEGAPLDQTTDSDCVHLKDAIQAITV